MSTTKIAPKKSHSFLSEQPYTFDKVVRLLLTGLIIAGIILLIRYLSNVLVPFFIALLLAYLLDPLVCFVQKNMRVRHRGISVVLSLLIISLIISVALWWLIPQFVSEMQKLGQLIKSYLQNTTYQDFLPPFLDQWLRNMLEKNNFQDLINASDISQMLKNISQPLLKIFSGSINILFSTLGLLMILIYLVFILIDYPKFESSWPKLIPSKFRPITEEIVEDLKLSMRIYFRNQFLIASIVGILMAIGFKIIDLPLGITLGLIIGILNIVPYLQVLGFLPAILLALLKSMESGESFWQVLLAVSIVIVIVQLIQDLILVPRIMGKAYNMNPAIILLSLSIWGTIMGILGMLLALPLTTLIVSYYKRLIINRPSTTKEDEEDQEVQNLKE